MKKVNALDIWHSDMEYISFIDGAYEFFTLVYFQDDFARKRYFADWMVNRDKDEVSQVTIKSKVKCMYRAEILTQGISIN